MMYLKLTYWLLGCNFSKIRDGMRNQDENNITREKIGDQTNFLIQIGRQRSFT
jgi:hypothetical protein